MVFKYFVKKKLFKVVFKGPKLMKSKCTDFEKVKTRIADGVHDCINICYTARNGSFALYRNVRPR